MIGVVFTINNVDFSDKLSTYQVDCEYEYPNVITTIDGTEHYGKANRRTTITFSLRPLSETETSSLYSALTAAITVQYTDPQLGQTQTTIMRFDGNVSSLFGLTSIDGNRYYKGGLMTLRQLTPR